MKIAICFSGEPRFVDKCHDMIKRNIIDPNNIVDVFVHTWYDNSIINKKLYTDAVSSFANSTIDLGVTDKIVDLYKPKKIIIDSPRHFSNSRIDFDGSLDKYFAGYKNSVHSKQEYRDIRISNIYSMWYSIMKSIELKKEYELENDFKYDIVIKCRFDLIVRSPIYFGNYNNEKLNYQELGQPDGMVSDWINFSNSSNMDVYSTIFNNIELLSNICINKHGAFSSESLIRSIIDIFNIGMVGSNFGLQLPRHGVI